MNFKTYRSIFLLFMMLSLPAVACSVLNSDSESSVPRNALVVDVVANSSLEPWLATAVTQFNATETETSSGDQIYVQLHATESGQAVTEISSDELNAGLWIPEEPVWTNLLADQGNSAFQNTCVSVAESPLVIGMWRDVAESLGWPSLPLGWLDVGSLAADPSAWQYYTGGSFGDALRLSHTHPGLSGSGISTLLALVQAAESKTEAVTTEDIQQPVVQASVGSFESAVAWFSNSTNNLGATMSERGESYLGAAVMYESTVVQYGGGSIVPVYPLEGTFVATHPACINSAAEADVQEAAEIFRDYLVGDEGQTTAVSFGLRPVNDAVTVGAPLDASRGVDLSQPVIRFNPPTVETIYAVQELWQEARKDVNLVMLLDTSGSMRGRAIDNMLEAAEQFVQQMGEDDYISIIAFSDQPNLLIQHEQVGASRQKIINTIQGLRAAGDTTLFDAIGDGATVIASTQSVDTANALVVLTDGEDTASTRYGYNSALIEAATANNTTVFTIAYGSSADEDVLMTIASEANGNFYQGDEASIAAIYEEMSAAFGGSVGVGR
ncbi:MAG: VWA domain-containing protein [Ardenticatenaceae bacterium]|nr:VWA domain-containing protein [Ardenticatenaceae bacterium]